MATTDLHSVVFQLTERIKLALDIATGQPSYKALTAIQEAERALSTLEQLRVPDKRLKALVVELLSGAIANTRYPHTMRAEFRLGESMAWAMAQKCSYLEVGQALFEELAPLARRTDLSEPEHATRNTLVMACQAWLMASHRSLERHEIEKLPIFHDAYMFMNGLA